MTTILLAYLTSFKRWSHLSVVFIALFLCCSLSESKAALKADVVAFAGNDTVVGLCGLKLLDGSKSSGDLVYYEWRFVDGPKIINFSNRYSESTFFQAFEGGDYEIELLVKDSNGIEARDTVHFFINSLLADAGDNREIGACEIVQFNTDSSTLGDGYTFSWYPQDELTNGNEANPRFEPGIFDEGKEFRFYFTVKDTFGCEDVDEVRIKVGNAPLADVSNSFVRLGCDSLMLDGSFSYGDDISYTWKPISESFSNPVAPFMTNISNDVSSATLVVEDRYGCKDSSVVDLSSEQFYVNVGSDDTIGYCENYTIRAAGSTSGNNVEWEPASMIGSPRNPLNVTLRSNLWRRNMTDEEVSKTFPFVLKIERESDGCIEADTLNITVFNAAASVNAGPDKTSGYCKTILDGSADSSYVSSIHWVADVPVFSMPENRNKNTLLNPEIILGDAYEQGTISFTLNATDRFGCRVSDNVRISVAQGPAISIDPIYYFPNGCDPVKITSTRERIDSLVWTPAFDLDNPYAEEPVFTGTHDEVLRVSAYDQYGCKDTAEAHIIWSPVTANAGSDLSAVQYQAISIGDSEASEEYVYTWTILSGTGATLSNADERVCRFVSTSQGQFELELSVKDGTGCTAKDTLIVNVGFGKRVPIINAINISPELSFENDSVVLKGEAESLDGFPLEYTWQLPNNATQKGQEVKVKAGVSGWLVLSVYDGFDTVKDSVFWTVTPEYPIDSLEIISPLGDSICQGQSISFSLKVKAGHKERLSYLWWVNDEDPGKLENLSIETGETFTIYCKAFNSTQFLIDSFRVVVVKPEMLFLEDTLICSAETLSIEPSFKLAGGRYTFYKETELLGTSFNPTFIPTESAQYSFTRENLYGCIDSALLNVDVYEVPRAFPDSLELSEGLRLGQLDLATNDSGAVANYRLLTKLSALQAYLTRDGDFTYNADTTMINGRDVLYYEISARACPHLKDTSTVTVLLRNAEGLGLIMSNAFSPNGDNVNDQFIIRGITDYLKNELYIYNKFGLLVYEAKPYQNNWDGTRNRGFGFGEELPEGTYFYVLKVKNKVYLEGTIEIRR